MLDAEKPACPLWAKIIATGGGVGYIPIAPGTFGSLAAMVISIGLIIAYDSNVMDYCLISRVNPSLNCITRGEAFILIIPFALICCLIGFVAADKYAKTSGIRDPHEVVIDEFAGQSLTLIGYIVTGVFIHNWTQFVMLMGLAFILFHLLDIWKPWPIRWFEKLPGGWGIMMDDVVAGIIGAIILAVIVHFHWLPGM